MGPLATQHNVHGPGKDAEHSVNRARGHLALPEHREDKPLRSGRALGDERVPGYGVEAVLMRESPIHPHASQVGWWWPTSADPDRGGA